MFRRWRRIDQPGLEVATIDIARHGVTVSATLIDASDTPFSLRYVWMLTPQWVTRALRIDRLDGHAHRLIIERAGEGIWYIDGAPAPHLDGCDEIDLSATPFCNTLAIRRLGGDGTLTAAYINASDLFVTPSRQRYEKISYTHWRYHDLGVASGFSADLELDEDLLVKTYAGLFEAI